MTEKRLDNAEEKLDCKKKYLYEYAMFWECNEGSKCQILEDDVVDLLNEQQSKIRLLEKENEDLQEVNKENQRLHEENVKQCERWRSLYELKDAEVTARVNSLNKVCEYYTSEVLFKSDTDPNRAVKEVINEILNAPIYEE